MQVEMSLKQDRVVCCFEEEVAFLKSRFKIKVKLQRYTSRAKQELRKSREPHHKHQIIAQAVLPVVGGDRGW